MVSPDGRQLAIVHGDADVVTLVDAERFAVVRTTSFAPRASLLERLGLVPGLAEAKAADGQEKRALFAPAG